jgi:hypothetical protein
MEENSKKCFYYQALEQLHCMYRLDMNFLIWVNTKPVGNPLSEKVMRKNSNSECMAWKVGQI